MPISLPDLDTIDAKSLCNINERYTLISGILPFVSDFRMRNERIAAISAEYGICRHTIINYLCLYLAFQDKAVLAPKHCVSNTTLSRDEKNFRWAINKFYLNQNKNSLEVQNSKSGFKRISGYYVRIPFTESCIRLLQTQLSMNGSI